MIFIHGMNSQDGVTTTPTWAIYWRTAMTADRSRAHD